MRLIDQSATLEWFPAMTRAVRFGAKIMPQPKRQSFETVAAAAEFVRANLSQRDMPEITTSAAEGVLAERPRSVPMGVGCWPLSIP